MVTTQTATVYRSDGALRCSGNALARLLVGLAIGTGAAAPGCDRPGGASTRPAADRAPAVTVRPVEQRDVERSVEVVGTLYGAEDATLSAKVGGRIVSVFLDLGDRAAPGQPLAQIDRTDYELSLRQKELAVREVLAKLNLERIPEGPFDPSAVPTVQKARLEASNAEARFSRGKRLHEQSPPLISDQDFADLQTAWEVARSAYQVELLTAQSLLNQAASAQAQVDIARQALSDTTVRAPQTQRSARGTEAPQPWTTNPSTDAASGVAEVTVDALTFAVAERLVSVGEYVREGTALFRVVDDNPVKLRASVPERFVSDLRVGQPVRLRFEAYSEEFAGTVSRVSPEVDAQSRAFMIEALVPNDQRRLKPGGFARARVITGVDRGVLHVPAAAVARFAGVSKVFTIGPEGRAQEHVVQPAAEGGGWLELLDAGRLAPGQQVIVENVSRLANGMAVTAKPEARGRPDTAAAPATMPSR